MLKDQLYNIIVVNTHVQSEDKGNDIKDRFYEEIERLFDQLIKVLGNISSTAWKENIFKQLREKYFSTFSNKVGNMEISQLLLNFVISFVIARYR